MGPRVPRKDPGLSPVNSGGYSVVSQTLYVKGGAVRSSDIEALTCGICLKILREPIQIIICGCRFCNACMEGLTKLNPRSGSALETFTCPIDGESFTQNEIRKDKGCMKEIEQLEVDCPMLPPCEWRGPVTAMEVHQSEMCPNATIKCKRGCGASFLRLKESEHAQECPKREETCSYCLDDIPKDELEDHYLSCPSHPVTCDFCSDHIPERKQFEKHLEEVCTECELTCPMAKLFSCNFKGKRGEMAQHTMNTHLLTALEKMSQLTVTVVTLQASNEELTKQVKKKDEKIDRLEQRLSRVEEFMRSGVSGDDCLEFDGPKTKRRFPSEIASHRGVSALSGEYSSGIVKKSPQTYSRYDSSSAEYGSHQLGETVDRHENQIARLHENMQSMQKNMTQYSIAVDELRLRQDVQDVKTTHGTFIWKIPDMRRRYRDALDRKTISLYSPPFQTSPHGYRMCIRVYLNGDGAGKGTYISLFFVLMRSEHDDLLDFPFKQSVRFTLINQENRAESISEAFAPDLKSQSFQRPVSDMNIASGFPKFARQSVLQDERFTRGNVIYIKAQVDLKGLALD